MVPNPFRSCSSRSPLIILYLSVIVILGLTGQLAMASEGVIEPAKTEAIKSIDRTKDGATAVAQQLNVPVDTIDLDIPEAVEPRIIDPLPVEPLPDEPLFLPPPEELLPVPLTPSPTDPDSNLPAAITVERYEVVGSTVFEPGEFAAVTAQFVGTISFAELLQARSAVTQLYVEQGYITSGAFIPPQTLEDGVVVIQVVEGSLEAVNVTGNRRLRSSYIRDRLQLAGETPLNVPELLEGLQLLQLDPLIERISADLQAGVRPGTSLLQVEVDEADSFGVTPSFDNGRSPSVGSVRRQINVTQANLLGFGDGLSVGYTNTEGSNGVDASYSIPINPRDGRIQLGFGMTESEVIEQPFDELQIQSTSRYFELGYRQPLHRTPTNEFALGVSFTNQSSQTELGIDDIGPFPLSPGADEEGRTRVSALRFYQEWTERSSQHVLAARSQFSLGVGLFDATINEGAPDSQFLSWRGQGQWVRLLAPDFLLLVRGDVQLAPEGLLPLEQFGLGGQQSIRGYRQDALLTDNGALFSAEVRVPVLRIPEWDGLLQVVPFLDAGTAWNIDTPDPDPRHLAGAGMGVLWQMGDTFSARLDVGFPLVSVESRESTWQENGIYFSVSFTPF